MKKLFAEKDEGVAELVENILSDPEEEITVVIPRNAALGRSASNFNLLKREADAAGKKISIESVDESVLALAKSSRLQASHPLLDGRTGLLSDIIPKKTEPRVETRPLAVTKKPKKIKEESAAPPKILHVQKIEVGSSAADRDAAGEDLGKEIHLSRVSRGHDRRDRGRRWRPNWKLFLRVAIPVAVIIFVIWILNTFFAQATVTINFKKIPWTYDHQILADKSVSKFNLEKSILPAELFTAEKNTTQLFTASGSGNVSEKATGKITIYNSYSSKPQVLVAMTRFATADGKIFRLADQVVVPGATIKDGNIISAKIEANVVAGSAGPEYNIGPAPRLTIPGFKGTPRYAGFYGELKLGTSGGFIGKKSYPTQDDIKNAKARASEILKTSLQSNFLTSYPPDFKILENASQMSVTKLNVNEGTDKNGKFSVFGEANIAAVGFRELDLKSFLLALASKDNPNDIFDDLKLNYGQIKPDFNKGNVTFSLSASGILKPSFSAEEFAGKILGRSVSDARSLISGLQGLSDAKVSLWPVWLGRIPTDLRRVKVLVN